MPICTGTLLSAIKQLVCLRRVTFGVCFEFHCAAQLGTPVSRVVHISGMQHFLNDSGLSTAQLFEQQTEWTCLCILCQPFSKLTLLCMHSIHLLCMPSSSLCCNKSLSNISVTVPCSMQCAHVSASRSQISILEILVHAKLIATTRMDSTSSMLARLTVSVAE